MGPTGSGNFSSYLVWKLSILNISQWLHLYLILTFKSRCEDSLTSTFAHYFYFNCYLFLVFQPILDYLRQFQYLSDYNHPYFLLLVSHVPFWHCFKDRENITCQNLGSLCECSFCYCRCNYLDSGKPLTLDCCDQLSLLISCLSEFISSSGAFHFHLISCLVLFY